MIFRWTVAALLSALMCFPRPASAQSWFSKELCGVSSSEFDPGALDAAELADLEAGAAQIENSRGRLWKVTSPEGAVSHLWGTMHSNDPLILNLPDTLRALLSKAEYVALENDPIFKSRLEHENWMQGGSFYRDVEAPGAYANLDPRVFGWIKQRLASMGYDAEIMSWFTASGLATVMLGDPCNDFANGVLPIQDYRILMLGLDANADVLGLEPLDAMLLLMNRSDRLDTALALIESYGAYLNPEATKSSRQTGFALYLQGRIGEMIVWDRSYMIEFFGMEKGQRLLSLLDGYLVDERNQGFLANALPLLNRGGGVIAVGSFHLPGRNGLVSLFRRAGFAVERVYVDGERP